MYGEVVWDFGVYGLRHRRVAWELLYTLALHSIYPDPNQSVLRDIDTYDDLRVF